MTALTWTVISTPLFPLTATCVPDADFHGWRPVRYSYVRADVPPALAGGDHETRMRPREVFAFRFLTAPGVLLDDLGVTGWLGTDACEVPTAFVAVTAKV